MFSFALYDLEYNKNGEKLIDFFNKNTNINSKDGIIGGKINEYIDKKLQNINGIFDKTIDDLGNKIGTKISDKLIELSTTFASDLIQLVAFGVISYSMYQCIKMMFLGNRSINGSIRPMDKVLFGYFIFFILKILNTVVRVRGGICGK